MHNVNDNKKVIQAITNPAVCKLHRQNVGNIAIISIRTTLKQSQSSKFPMKIYATWSSNTSDCLHEQQLNEWCMRTVNKCD